MSRYIITLEDGANYDAIKGQVEAQGGRVSDSDPESMRSLGLMTVEMPESGLEALKQFSGDIIVEPDQEVRIQQ